MRRIQKFGNVSRHARTLDCLSCFRTTPKGENRWSLYASSLRLLAGAVNGRRYVYGRGRSKHDEQLCVHFEQEQTTGATWRLTNSVEALAMRGAFSGTCCIGLQKLQHKTAAAKRVESRNSVWR